MRAIWSGAISFGLVNIPVKLYSAAGESGLDLDMLAKPDLSRVKYKKIAVSDGREIESKDIVKGYEIEKGQYVIIEDEDFEKANAKKTKSIEIVNFVMEDEIDPIYFEKPYYLEPDKSAEKPYALLREALRQAEKIGISKYVLRNREHLAALKPVGDVILLNQMRYYQDVRDYQNLTLPKKENLSKAEIEMAKMLIEQLTQPFQPENYHDTYIEELQRVIKEKATGRSVEIKGAAPQATKMNDLMATLKASLEANKSITKDRPAAKKEPNKKNSSKSSKQK